MGGRKHHGERCHFSLAQWPWRLHDFHYANPWAIWEVFDPVICLPDCYLRNWLWVYSNTHTHTHTIARKRKKYLTLKLNRREVWISQWASEQLEYPNLWSFPLDFKLLVSNIFYAHVLHQKIWKMHGRVEAIEAISFISSFMACVPCTHSVLPSYLTVTLSCSPVCTPYHAHKYICLHMNIYCWLGSRFEEQVGFFFFLKLCELINVFF